MAKKTIRGKGNEGLLQDVTSGAGVVTVGPIQVDDFDNISFQLVTTSTLAGAWTIQASNDYNALGDYNGAERAGTWTDVTALFTTMAAVVTGGSSRYTQSVGFAGKALRIVWTPTSGAGNVSAWMCAKGAQ